MVAGTKCQLVYALAPRYEVTTVYASDTLLQRIKNYQITLATEALGILDASRFIH